MNQPSFSLLLHPTEPVCFDAVKIGRVFIYDNCVWIKIESNVAYIIYPNEGRKIELRDWVEVMLLTISK